MRTHPLYAECRRQIIAALKREDEILGPGLLRLRWLDEDLVTIITTSSKTLQEAYGVEAALWYCKEPSDDNFQPVVFQLLPVAGKPNSIHVVAFEGQNDVKSPIVEYNEHADLTSVVSTFLKGFMQRAKDAVEYRN